MPQDSIGVTIPGVGRVFFPATMPQEKIAQEAAKLHLQTLQPVLDAQAKKFPTRPKVGINDPTESLTAAQLGDEQAKSNIVGALQFLPNLPGAIWNTLKANPEESAANLIGLAKPLQTIARGTGSLIAPNSVKAPTGQDWQGAAEFSGANAIGTGLGGAAAKVDSVVRPGGPIAQAIDLIPSKARAEANFNAVMAKARGVPIDTTQIQKVIDRSKQLKATGSTAPKVVNDTARLLDKPIATTLNNEPYIPYEQGRDLSSSAGRLSDTERLSSNRQMKANVAELGTALKTANRDVAVKAGMGDAYDAAMKEYARVMKIHEVRDTLGGIAKNKLVRTIVGVGVMEEIVRRLLK